MMPGKWVSGENSRAPGLKANRLLWIGCLDDNFIALFWFSIGIFKYDDIIEKTDFI
jgi:hypothetical protein